MITPTGNENILNFFSSLTSCAYSFFIGVAAGVAGNWVWYKCKNSKKDPHLQLKTDSNGTHFSGVLNSSNKDQVINTLSCSVTSTIMEKDYKASRTNIAPSHSTYSSNL